MVQIHHLLRRIIFGKPHRSTLDFTLDGIHQAVNNINAVGHQMSNEVPLPPDENYVDMTNIIIQKK